MKYLFLCHLDVFRNQITAPLLFWLLGHVQHFISRSSCKQSRLGLLHFALPLPFHRGSSASFSPNPCHLPLSHQLSPYCGSQHQLNIPVCFFISSLPSNRLSYISAIPLLSQPHLLHLFLNCSAWSAFYSHFCCFGLQQGNC